MDQVWFWSASAVVTLPRSMNSQEGTAELRLRWYHAPVERMAANLKNVGVLPHVSSQIGPILDTCDVCWKLEAPGNVSIATSRVVEKLNELVQHAIMFAQPHPKMLESEGGSEDPTAGSEQPESVGRGGEPQAERSQAFPSTGVEAGLQAEKGIHRPGGRSKRTSLSDQQLLSRTDPRQAN